MQPELPLETLVRHRLTQLIAIASAEDQRFAYGFLLHRRDAGQGMGFGIITSGGESLLATGALLASLERELCWAYGAVPLRLRARGADPLSPERPIREIVIEVPDGILNDAELRAYCPAHGPVAAEAFAQPLVLLTASRPAGWPS